MIPTQQPALTNLRLSPLATMILLLPETLLKESQLAILTMSPKLTRDILLK